MDPYPFAGIFYRGYSIPHTRYCNGDPCCRGDCQPGTYVTFSKGKEVQKGSTSRVLTYEVYEGPVRIGFVRKKNGRWQWKPEGQRWRTAAKDTRRKRRDAGMALLDWRKTFKPNR